MSAAAAVTPGYITLSVRRLGLVPPLWRGLGLRRASAVPRQRLLTRITPQMGPLFPSVLSPDCNEGLRYQGPWVAGRGFLLPREGVNNCVIPLIGQRLSQQSFRVLNTRPFVLLGFCASRDWVCWLSRFETSGFLFSPPDLGHLSFPTHHMLPTAEG